MIQLRPHRCARKAPAAMRRRTVDADTPRYAAASPTENSGLGKNSMGLLILMVVCDFDMGPTPSASAVYIPTTPLGDLRRLLTTVTHRRPSSHLPGGIYLLSADTTHTAAAPAYDQGRRSHTATQRHSRSRGTGGAPLGRVRAALLAMDGVLPSPPVANRRETGARHCTPWPVSPVAPCSQGGYKGGVIWMGAGSAYTLSPSGVNPFYVDRSQRPRRERRSAHRSLSTIARGPALCQDLYHHKGYNF